MEIQINSSTRLVVESFKGKSRHGAFPGIRLRLGGKRKLKTIASFHAGKALELAGALQTVFSGMDDGDGFFQSRQWLRLRYETLKKHGGRCQACGRSAHDGVVLHIDHIKPRSKHPELELEPDNLQCTCESCNLAKSNTDQTDWRPQHNEVKK